MHRFRVAFADSLSDRFVLPKGMWRLALGLLLGFLAFPLLPAFLAQTTSTIEGTVSDRQGLTISGAEVSVTRSEERRVGKEGRWRWTRDEWTRIRHGRLS